jgi:hypothetical protein
MFITSFIDLKWNSSRVHTDSEDIFKSILSFSRVFFSDNQHIFSVL